MNDEENRKPGAVDGEGLPADEMKHLEVVEEAIAQSCEEPRGRRGSLWQKGRRELERRVREGAVGYRGFMVIEGGRREEAADDLALSPRTLREWSVQVKEGTLDAEARGRPLKDSGRLKRNEVIAFLRDVGPGVGVGRILGVFPEMPRCEVIDLVARFRRVYVREHMLVIHELEWTMAGAVWAMDHAVPREPIAGGFQAVLAVRDLASGEQLLWEPVGSEDAGEAVGKLDELFALFGPPLVMKSDNGSAFKAEVTRDLESSRGVIPLLSPPRLPPYNGSIESGIHAMKDRTSWKAALNGRPDECTPEDLKAARFEANELPKGPKISSAGELWRNRPAITPELRVAFQATVADEEAQERALRGLGSRQAVGPSEEAEIKRTAIRRALVAHGILKFRRRRIPLPKKLLRSAKIS